MTWRAGFGRATITPQVPVALAGFGDRTEVADSVHDDLEAHALWLSDGERAVCLLALDLLGLSPRFADPIRAAVGDALGLPREGVLTSCTHTHSGPNAMSGGEKLGWPTPAGYERTLVEGCLTAARAAVTTAVVITSSYVSAPLPVGLSYNRRELPYDPWFAALDLRRDDGSRLGILANIAIHPVLLGSPWLQVSTDWVGPFREALAARAGGEAILLSGSLGDVNPVEHHTDVPTHLAEAADETATMGGLAAEALVRALADATPMTGALRTTSRSLTVPAEGQLAALLDITEETVELVEWTLGDVSLVGVPGEAFHALGRSITDARGGRALIAGLAPSWHGYLPVPYGDGYEEMVSLGEKAVRMIGDALIAGAGA